MASLRDRLSDAVLIPGESFLQRIAWNIAFWGALLALILLPLVKPTPYREIVSFFPDGLWVTFQVTLLSIVFALLLGILAVLARMSRFPPFNLIASLYTEIIRGIPLLVQIFYIYYVIARVVQLPPIVSAVTGMAICYGAYIAEILRGGIQSIPKGQMEAAIALGLSRWQAIRLVVLPQTLKVVLPPIGNEFIALLKDSSLVSIIAVIDIFRRAREYASVKYFYFESYTMVALVYLVLTLFFSKLVNILEKRLHHGR
ncbi:MAG: amino acid ABC transporter permease [Brevinematales bacterium]|nr:amino acid ABC transporter permease [Brevinematales bacterium]